MRALAGPAMLLVMVGGFLIYRSTSKEATPSRQFAELELAGADAEHTGSCYSLSTVLIANGVFGRTIRTWSPAGKDPKDKEHEAWTLNIEAVVQSPSGPVRDFQSFTFERADKQVRLTAVDASKGRPTEIDKNIDLLLEAPNDRHSTPVDRCLPAGATGYHFKPKS